MDSGREGGGLAVFSNVNVKSERVTSLDSPIFDAIWTKLHLSSKLSKEHENIIIGIFVSV